MCAVCTYGSTCKELYKKKWEVFCVRPGQVKAYKVLPKVIVMYVNRVQFTFIICYDMGHVTFRYFLPVGVVIGLLSPHISRKWVNSMHEATILRSD